MKLGMTSKSGCSRTREASITAMRPPRSLAVVCSALALPAAILLAACSPGTLRIIQSDSPQPNGMEAVFQGTVIADENGCVQARTSTSTLVALVWPHGYSVRGDSKSFEVLDGSKSVVARSGATLAIGGGGADAFQDAWTERDCAAGGKLWMVGKVDPT